MYENAVKVDSTNEELHTQLFMSYVRISDFKLQQQSAMALYKQKPKNPYYCWAVMSIVLQVIINFLNYCITKTFYYHRQLEVKDQ